MTLDENIAAFEPFLNNLINSFETINIFLNPADINKKVKHKEQWSNSINIEKERVRDELTESEYDFYEKSIRQIETRYTSSFLSK